MLAFALKCRKGCTPRYLRFSSSLGEGILSEIGVHKYSSKPKRHEFPVSMHLRMIPLTVLIARSAGLL